MKKQIINVNILEVNSASSKVFKYNTRFLISDCKWKFKKVPS